MACLRVLPTAVVRAPAGMLLLNYPVLERCHVLFDGDKLPLLLYAAQHGERFGAGRPPPPPEPQVRRVGHGSCGEQAGRHGEF